jgi:AcrR family transcriptional regulator
MTEPTRAANRAPRLTPRPMRADARRNYERLLVAARTAFTMHGADASLDDIARRAGVGPGTLYRHFPTRQALLEAVYRDGVEEMCSRAYELLDTMPPGEALAAWLRAMADYVATKRGLAMELVASLGEDGSELFASCKQAMVAAGTALLDAAKEAGAVRPETDLKDVLKLVHAIGAATEQAPEDADRLLSLVLDGLWRRDR